MKPAIAGLLLLVLSCKLTVGLADDALDRARDAIAAGQHAQALALLLPMEDARAGDPDFDMLLGRAALETGEAALSLFALERVLAARPNDLEARALLARALFEVKDDTQARKELQSLRTSPVSDAVKDTIDRYLAAIDARDAGRQTWQWQAAYEISTGFDSNVNGATDDDTVTIPGLGRTALVSASREQESLFIAHQLSARVAWRFDPRIHVVGGASVDFRAHTNNQAEGFDHRDAAFDLGLVQKLGKNVFSATVRTQSFQVDNIPIVNQTFTRRTNGLTVQWRHEADARTQFTVFGQGSSISYKPRSQSSRDVLQALVGGGYAHAFDHPGRPTLFLSGYAGRDWPRNDGVAFAGRGFLGVRAGGQYSLREDLDLTAAAAYEYSNYGGVVSLFATDRNDQLVSLRAGLRYVPAEQWLVRPEIRFTRNFSNITVNDYARMEALVSVRRSFN
ncbi:MAG: tetratricopeptide repeat protein [Gammaproteobacteria bacterium]|nr:tetratricopeptide repeat protein [Gammaproteobacteria bacterium]